MLLSVLFCTTGWILRVDSNIEAFEKENCPFMYVHWFCWLFSSNLLLFFLNFPYIFFFKKSALDYAFKNCVWLKSERMNGNKLRNERCDVPSFSHKSPMPLSYIPIAGSKFEGKWGIKGPTSHIINNVDLPKVSFIRD